MAKNQKTHPSTWVEIAAKQRGSWGDVNPVTKVIPDKRKKPAKHKKKELDEE